jgi:hypothetical protein
MLDIHTRHIYFWYAFRAHLLLLKINVRHKIKTKYRFVNNLTFIFSTSFVLLYIQMLLFGTMNVAAFLFIREKWRFYVGALFFSSERAMRTQTSSTSHEHIMRHATW